MTHVTAAQCGPGRPGLRRASRHRMPRPHPPHRNCNSLYKSATGIHWDYEKADLIAGTASNPNTGHMASFEVDPMAMSDFEIANAIWDAIDEQ